MGNVGSVFPNKWMPSQLSNSGRITATYTPKKTGGDQITISGTGVDPAGATTAYFQVVNCDYDIEFSAANLVDNPNTKIDTLLHGQAVISIDEKGVLTGEGTYQYTLDITYIPPKTITCDPLSDVTNDSTFTVAGTASTQVVSFKLKFYPVDLKAVEANCKDKQNKDITQQVFPGGQVDVNGQLHLSTFNFPASVSEYQFPLPFGKEVGKIWLVKRKSK
jgi:hypothetical protein